MNTILFDHNREAFLPLTYTRPIADLRIGIVTIKEKWEHHFSSVSVKTEDYLSAKFPITLTAENLWINAQVLPNQDIIDEINIFFYITKKKKFNYVFHQNFLILQP